MNRIALAPSEVLTQSSPKGIKQSHELINRTRHIAVPKPDLAYATFAPMHYEERYAYPLLVWLHGEAGQLPQATEWSHTALLAAEKNAVGFYITGHPLENYADILKELNTLKSSDLTGMERGARISFGGIVTDLQVRTTKKGGRFGLSRLEDQEGGVKCVLWPEVFGKFESTIKADAAVLVNGRLELEDASASIIVDEVIRLQDVLQRKAKSVVIRLPEKNEYEPLLAWLFKLFDEHKGDCEIFLEMMVEDKMLVRARPHSALRVRGSVELESALVSQGCKVEWVNVTLN